MDQFGWHEKVVMKENVKKKNTGFCINSESHCMSWLLEKQKNMFLIFLWIFQCNFIFFFTSKPWKVAKKYWKKKYQNISLLWILIWIVFFIMYAKFELFTCHLQMNDGYTIQVKLIERVIVSMDVNDVKNDNHL